MTGAMQDRGAAPAHLRQAPPQPRLLFDGDHLQLLYLPGAAPLTLLTFDIMHARANGRSAFARRLCERNGFTLLGVVPKHPCWYPRLDIARIADQCRTLARGGTIAYGASMGGYGALRWGRFLGADHVLACSPQITIDPRETGDHDRRYVRFFDPALHRDMRVRPEHLPERAALLYDPRFRFDRFQAGLIAGAPGLGMIALPHTAHGTAACLAGSLPARAAFDLLVQAETEALRRLLLARRKTVPTYRLELAATALRRNRPALAEALAAPTRRANPIGYHLLMARQRLALHDPAGAEEHYRTVLALKPEHAIARLRLDKLRAVRDRSAA